MASWTEWFFGTLMVIFTLGVFALMEMMRNVRQLCCPPISPISHLPVPEGDARSTPPGSCDTLSLTLTGSPRPRGSHSCRHGPR